MKQIRLLFGGVVFLAAFLLFLVEPMAAKQLLPQLGGSAAVWITCLVFFQTALLIGYLYAHWLAGRANAAGHVVALALAMASAATWAVVPISFGGAQHPIVTVFGVLSLAIGLPFIALAATSPLLQAWWAQSHSSAVPYRLYALSNLASLLALAAYPSILEPYLTLRAQRTAWAGGFVVFAILSALLRLRMRRRFVFQPNAIPSDAAAATRFTRLLWLVLPLAASMQLSAVTEHLTANIAAIPLLWILPLAVYLITLILAFQQPRFLKRGILVRVLVLMLGSIAYMLTQTSFDWPLWLTIAFYLLELFVACLFCHCEAVHLRPGRASESTLFYLLFAGGGALGSFLIGIISPLLFRYNYDLPITFLITAAVALAALWRVNWSQRLLWSAATAAMLAVTIMFAVASRRKNIVAVRNFYGSLRVTQDYSTFPGATLRTLLNGTIQHGTQIFGTDELRRSPRSYYAADSGVGLALRFCCEGHAKNVGAIGLGAGSIAAYGHPGDRFRFYEINPADVPIARNVFTYMRDSGSTIEIVEGDARNSLTHEPPQHFDVLVVDAFSGDAIPLHLLTKEALALYRRHLAPGGIIAFHISNQHVDLEGPIAALVASAGMQARHVHSLADESRGEFNATWILVTDNTSFFQQSELVARAFQLDVKPGARLWTDDYSALLPVLRW
jgi:SAM-dependent methyltransferase